MRTRWQLVEDMATIFAWAFGLLLGALTVWQMGRFLPEDTYTMLATLYCFFAIASLIVLARNINRLVTPRRRRARRQELRRDKSEIIFYSLGLTFYFLGFGCIVFRFFLIILAPLSPVPIDLFMVGLGLLSIGLGFIALAIGKKSDKRMEAMANLEFYEKIAVIETYIALVKARQNVVVEAIYNDIKGAKQLKKYVKPEIEQELNKKIQELIDIAKLKRLRELERRLQDLKKEDC